MPKTSVPHMQFPTPAQLADFKSLNRNNGADRKGHAQMGIDEPYDYQSDGWDRAAADNWLPGAATLSPFQEGGRTGAEELMGQNPMYQPSDTALLRPELTVQRLEKRISEVSNQQRLRSDYTSAPEYNKYRAWATVIVEDLLEEDPEFSIHKPNRTTILQNFAKVAPSVVSDFLASATVISRSDESASLVPRRIQILLLVVTALTALVGFRAFQIQVLIAPEIIAAGEAIGLRAGERPPVSTEELILRTAVVIVSMSASGLTLWFIRRAARRRASRPDRTYIPASFQEHVRVSLRKTLNSLYRNEFGLVFRLPTPALVASDSPENLVEVESVRQLRDFISDHRSSSLGLAGPRGSGKTSTLHLLTRDLHADSIATLCVIVPAPVRYESEDLVRLIIDRFIDTALGAHRKIHPADRRPPMRRAGAGPILWMAGGGTLLIAYRFWAEIVNVWRPDMALWLGAALLAIAAALALRLAVKRQAFFWLAYRGGLVEFREQWPLAFRIASEELRYSWETERTKNVSSTIGDLIGGSSGKSSKFSENARGRSEWPTVFHQLATQFLMESRYKRLVLVIDELDKLSDADSAIKVMNDIKDLMHVEGVHFIASVSDEAMDDFALRSMRFRTAVDSTFDEVIRTSGISHYEALDVLESRVSVFPRPLAYFCYAWSGRNARDLIRNARSVARVPAQVQGSLSAVALHVVWRDVQEAMEAYVRQSVLMDILTLKAKAALRRIFDLPPESALPQLLHFIQLVEHESSDTHAFRDLATYLECAMELIDEFSAMLDVANWTRDDLDGPLAESCASIARRLGDLRQGRRFTDPN